MFVVDRSFLAVLVPLALLAGVVAWSNHSGSGASAPQQDAQRESGLDQALAANLPSS